MGRVDREHENSERSLHCPHPWLLHTEEREQPSVVGCSRLRCLVSSASSFLLPRAGTGTPKGLGGRNGTNLWDGRETSPINRSKQRVKTTHVWTCGTGWLDCVAVGGRARPSSRRTRVRVRLGPPWPGCPWTGACRAYVPCSAASTDQVGASQMRPPSSAMPRSAVSPSVRAQSHARGV